MRTTNTVSKQIGSLELIMTIKYLDACQLACIKPHIDQLGITQKSAHHILLEEPPVIYLQDGKHPIVVNEKMVAVMAMPKKLHPKDKVLCFSIADEFKKLATLYFNLIDPVIKLPDPMNVIKDLIKITFDPIPSYEQALIKAMLGKEESHRIKNSDFIRLIKDRRQNSTIMEIKKDLGLTENVVTPSDNTRKSYE